MKLTFKAIARSAGYYVRLSSAINKFGWLDNFTSDDKNSIFEFDTEEEAYRDCCIKCGLVETNIEGMVIS